jgi:hypothetical protein
LRQNRPLLKWNAKNGSPRLPPRNPRLRNHRQSNEKPGHPKVQRPKRNSRSPRKKSFRMPNPRAHYYGCVDTVINTYLIKEGGLDFLACRQIFAQPVR